MLQQKSYTLSTGVLTTMLFQRPWGLFNGVHAYKGDINLEDVEAVEAVEEKQALQLQQLQNTKNESTRPSLLPWRILVIDIVRKKVH